MDGIAAAAPPPQVTHSHYREKRTSVCHIREFQFDDFQARLACGERRVDDGSRDTEAHELMKIEMPAGRVVHLQAKVRTSGQGAIQENEVAFVLANRSADRKAVFLSAMLGFRNPAGDWQNLLDTPLNYCLGDVESVPLFSFRGSNAQHFCPDGSLRLKLDMVVFDYERCSDGAAVGAPPTPPRSDPNSLLGSTTSLHGFHEEWNLFNGDGDRTNRPT